ncbi:MAG: tripartite tricarboxylate transporter substrate binding protein [Pseudomonadota bacterium]
MRNLIVLLLAFSINVPVFAQAYPVRPVSMVVTYAAGGVTDQVARALAQRLSAGLGQPVIVENRPGASGNIGSMSVAKSAPDGYQILFGTNGPQAVNVALFDKLPYDPVKDLVPVAMVTTAACVLVVSPASKITSVAELLKVAQTAKEPLTYSSAGNASTPHLAGEFFKQQSKTNIRHIPYKGDMPALTDLMGEHVSMSFPAIASAIPLIKGGKLRPLAVTSATRSKLLPEVPTIRELGLPNYEMTGWFGVFLPKGTPPEIVERLAKEVRVALGDDKFRQQLQAAGLEPAEPLEGSAFGKFQLDQIHKLSLLVKSAQISVE